MVSGFDRGYLGSGWKGTIFLSLLLHAALLALVFLSPSFPSPRITFGPVYNVSLVDSPGGSLSTGSSPAGGDARAAEKELKAARRVETMVKRNSAPEPEVPISRIEERGLQERGRPESALEKAIEEVKKKAAVTAAPKQPVPPRSQYRDGGDAKGDSGAAEKTKAASAEGSGVTASSGGDSGADERINAYYREIWSRVKAQWALPGGMMPQKPLESVIAITILRTGAVTEVKFEQRSGNRYFDESVMKAIQKASPLPPLPDWINGRSLNIGIRFHSAELNR
jgi:TonB family protein